MFSTMDKKWFHLNGFKQSNAAVCMLEQDKDDSNELMGEMFKLQLDCMNRRMNFFNYEKRILRNMDLFVLDNSLQESTVGNVKAQSVENKWKIYQEVMGVGVDYIAVASFSRSSQASEDFAQYLQMQSVDHKKHFAFVDCFDTSPTSNSIKTDLPSGLKKCQRYGIQNIVMELDLVSRDMNYAKFNAYQICELLNERINWIQQNISSSSLIFINIRDFSDTMRFHPARLLFLINFLSSFPENQRICGLMVEDGGKYYSEQLAVWMFCLREEMTRCGWKKCHLLVNIRDQYGLCNGTMLDCLADGATGLWASVCDEGGSMGHASYTVAITNLIRMGNNRIGKQFKCEKLRDAARNVTKLTTGGLPYPRQPVLGDRSAGIYFGLEPLNETAVRNVSQFKQDDVVVLSEDEVLQKRKYRPSHLQSLIDDVRRIWNECSETGEDVLDFPIFHNVFIAPYFGGYRNNDVNRLLEEVELKKGNKAWWKDFSAHLEWTADSFPETTTAQQLLHLTFRHRILVAMENKLLKQVEAQSVGQNNKTSADMFYESYNFNDDVFFRKGSGDESEDDEDEDGDGSYMYTLGAKVHNDDDEEDESEDESEDDDDGSFIYTLGARVNSKLDDGDEQDEEEIIMVEEVAEVESAFNEDDFFADMDNPDNWADRTDADDADIGPTTTYKIRVKTGNMSNAGTDSNVYITLCGDKRKTDKLNLEKDRFDEDGDNNFTIETTDVGSLKSIIVGHDNDGKEKSWYLVSVDVSAPSQGLNWKFIVNKWLNEDTKTEVEVSPSATAQVPYTIVVRTGDARDAGTDSNVYVNLVGEKGTTDKQWLGHSFEPNSEKTFSVEAEDVGRIKSVRIGHDNEGDSKRWNLSTVDVQVDEGRKQTFDGDRWIDQSNGLEAELFPKTKKSIAIDEDVMVEQKKDIPAEDNSLEKLQDVPIDYEITVQTGDIRGAGTDANVFVCIQGDKGINTGYIVLGPKDGDRSKIFERLCKDTFKVRAVDVGKITSIRVGHDNKGGFAGWYLDWLSIKAEGFHYQFSADRWLDVKEGDKKLEIELIPKTVMEIGQMMKYEVIVKTGDIKGAGTDANVFICVFGKDGKNTGNIILGPKDGDRAKIFEKNCKDTFTVEAIDIGEEVKFVRVGHDNKGGFAGWYLDWVSVKTSKFYHMFKADRWLDLKEANGKLECDLYPKPKETEVQSIEFTVGDTANDVKGQKVNVRTAEKKMYDIYVKTGDVRYAGTDAAVHIFLYGDKGVTGKIDLPANGSKTYKKAFERKQVDTYTVEALDVGNLERIRIGHDGAKPGAGWHLEEVEVQPAGMKKKRFPAKRWLDAKTGDKKIEVDLKPGKK